MLAGAKVSPDLPILCFPLLPWALNQSCRAQFLWKSTKKEEALVLPLFHHFLLFLATVLPPLDIRSLVTTTLHGKAMIVGEWPLAKNEENPMFPCFSAFFPLFSYESITAANFSLPPAINHAPWHSLQQPRTPLASSPLFPKKKNKRKKVRKPVPLLFLYLLSLSNSRVPIEGFVSLSYGPKLTPMKRPWTNLISKHHVEPIT